MAQFVATLLVWVLAFFVGVGLGSFAYDVVSLIVATIRSYRKG